MFNSGPLQFRSARSASQGCGAASFDGERRRPRPPDVVEVYLTTPLGDFGADAWRKAAAEQFPSSPPQATPSSSSAFLWSPAKLGLLPGLRTASWSR